MNGLRLFLAILCFTLAGCTTTVQTNPARTATEELLISTAAERAAAQIALQIPKEASVFVDGGNFEGTDSKYAIASIRSHLLQGGVRLIDDRKAADIIIEARAGALSTDRKTFLIGIPQFNIPIPFASAPLPFPEIAIYSSDEQKGVAKFAVTGYDAKKGALIAAQDPQYGFSHNTKKTLLAFITWNDSDFLPEGAEPVKANEAPEKNAKPHLEINRDNYAPPAAATSSSASPSVPPSSLVR